MACTAGKMRRLFVCPAFCCQLHLRMTEAAPPPNPSPVAVTAEGQRLAGPDAAAWRRWGPYVSDRNWGTVREDYSATGDAWNYLPHDHARSRAYRWGEDAIAGVSDDRQLWCLGLALWNGRDPILKERLFGLTNAEGNHGEDVKELYFHLDALPSHAYLRMLYKYPVAAFPYAQLVAENRRRNRTQPEYEILDTGVFDDDHYFDVTIEYAKAAPDDILLRVTVHNRSGAAEVLHILPQLWARNIWSWSGGEKPQLQLRSKSLVAALHPQMPALHLAIDQPAAWLFCENETNVSRLYNVAAPGPFKDGINDFLIHDNAAAIRDDAGTKCAAHVIRAIEAGGTATLRLRLCPLPEIPDFSDFDAIFTAREQEADTFYAALQRDIADPDARSVQRRALAGLIWSKQYYAFDVRTWLLGDSGQPPPPPQRLSGRNHDWQHLANADIIVMPDKWEYPWYAAWDCGFHAVTMALIDPAFAKRQVLLFLKDRFMHPSGQIPAYEWEFSDANPPVQSWAAWRVFQLDRDFTGRADHEFLRRVFHKLLLNFGWWVNRKDAQGRNIFQGGFLGLDNIEIFDRSKPLPTGGMIDQVDGTAWMAAFALHMMRIALELALVDGVYQDIATKFFDHFLYIAQAMSVAGDGAGLWHEQDGFFYDLLRLPDGAAVPLRVRSVVGLTPLFAVQVLEPELLAAVPDFSRRLDRLLAGRPDLAGLISHWHIGGEGDRRLLSLLRGHRLKALLRFMLDEAEFWSPHGIRGVSKIHKDAPFVYEFSGQRYEVTYLPAESDSGAFGGNSNWRGPVWLPINLLIVEALQSFQHYYGDDFVVEFPRGAGQMRPLREIAALLAARLCGLMLRGADGARPAMAAYPQLRAALDAGQLVLFHEYFNGDNGAGLGASHQTGWTAALALLLHRTEPKQP